MRISDWSSDVCSSDLVVPVIGAVFDTVQAPSLAEQRSDGARPGEQAALRTQIALPCRIGFAFAVQIAQGRQECPRHVFRVVQVPFAIGRASCRESECQYV